MRTVCVSITGVDCSDDDFTKSAFFTSLEECGLHVRGVTEHAFYPSGITIAVVLAESHAAISSWPDRRRIEIDLFCCSQEDKTELFLGAIMKHFQGFYKPFFIDREKMKQVTS